MLSKYLVEKISGRPVKFVHPKKQPWYKINKTNYLAAGSIIHHASKHSIVWGSGIIDHEQSIQNADFRAVRGPETRKHLLELGYNCPEVYGDPALLMPLVYNPQVKKKYKIGIIPHYHDYSQVQEWYKNDAEILVIDLMTLDVEEVTRQILSCEKTISSSLHGVIVSHAYQIPSVWVKFSEKIFGNDIKYKDYLESVELPFYQAEYIKEKYSLERLQKLLTATENLPGVPRIEALQKGLLESCPFVNHKKIRTS